MLFTLIAKGSDALFGLDDLSVCFMLRVRNRLFIMQLLRFYLNLFAYQSSLNIN